MRKDVMDYINQKKDLKQFLREQPIWYRKLMRNPTELQVMEIASMQFYKKTIPDQVDRITNSIQMASMMMSMFQAMNSQNG